MAPKVINVKLGRNRLSQSDVIVNREKFRAASVRGRDRCEVGSFGILPESWRAQFVEDDPDYVVSSYATPIAWHGARGWVMPAVKYSSTTSQHQNAVLLSLRGQNVIQSL